MRLLFFCLFICLGVKLFAQPFDSVQSNQPQKSFLALKDTSYHIIRNIFISGNKITKDFIINREITFKKGEHWKMQDLEKQIKITRHQIYNTELFVDDSVYVSNIQDSLVDIKIVLKERWYLFPLPYFKLIDRNFNQWWQQENRSLARVNYGIKFMEMNLTGRNDKLNVWLVNGYNQQVSLRYELPFFDKQLKHGLNVGIGYSRQHELNYATSLNNEQLFLKLENAYSRTNRRADITYSYRPDQKIRHYFRLNYSDEEIADTIVQLNPTYFPHQLNHLIYTDFVYSFQYFNTNNNAFPSDGIIFQANLNKKGFDKLTNMWNVSASCLYAKPLSKKSFYVLQGAATVKFPFNQYFYNQRLFGYGDFQLNGQEYNVVDGLVGVLSKLTIEHEIFKYIFKNPLKSTSHDKIPFQFFLKTYGNLGYAYTPYINNSLLNNKLNYTYGVGLDIVSAYDFVFKIEFSFNQLGVKDVYFHTRNDF